MCFEVKFSVNSNKMEASEPLVQLDLMDTQNGDAPESEQSEPSEVVDSQSG